MRPAGFFCARLDQQLYSAIFHSSLACSYERTEYMVDQYENLPLQPSTARRIIERLFNERPVWKRRDLATRVLEEHKAAGGIAGKQNELNVAKKALQDLQSDGMVVNASPGHWRWVSSASAPVEPTVKKETAETTPIIPVDFSDEDDSEEADSSTVKQIGSGSETVYVYFNPNDKKLAQLENRRVWECKVGRTGAMDSYSRLVGQGARTALSRLPVVGLLIKTNDSAALEKALHASLRLNDAQVADSPGIEWFMTSPELIELWHAMFQQALSTLRSQ